MEEPTVLLRFTPPKGGGRPFAKQYPVRKRTWQRHLRLAVAMGAHVRISYLSKSAPAGS